MAEQSRLSKLKNPESLAQVKFMDVLDYIADLENEVTELEECVKDGIAENDSLSEDISDLEDKIDDLESEISKLESEVEELEEKTAISSRSEAIFEAIPQNLDIITEEKIVKFIQSITL